MNVKGFCNWTHRTSFPSSIRGNKHNCLLLLYFLVCIKEQNCILILVQLNMKLGFKNLRHQINSYVSFLHRNKDGNFSNSETMNHHWEVSSLLTSNITLGSSSDSENKHLLLGKRVNLHSLVSILNAKWASWFLNVIFLWSFNFTWGDISTKRRISCLNTDLS